MIPRTITLVAAAVLASVGWAAPDTTKQKPEQDFIFRQGQSVYVAAFHTIEHFASHGLNVVPPSNVVDSHLPAELTVRKGFEKRKVYKLVNKVNDADFVFMVVIHHDAAEGLALAPEVFRESRRALNMEALREAAYARATAGPLKVHNLGRLSDHLVRQFHEDEGRPTHAKF